jgi:hypothetical protein
VSPGVGIAGGVVGAAGIALTEYSYYKNLHEMRE